VSHFGCPHNAPQRLCGFCSVVVRDCWLVARMERENLIHRTTDPADRGSSRIQLNASAKRTVDAARIVLQTGHQAAFSGFSRSEVEQLKHFLEKVVKNLEQDRL
jgi:MarR family transcriptional regulator for hemolysin